jgi:uncharacterized membrane protein YhaH (DUF805 family)
MVNYWLTAFKKYADFNGRARRSEYWYFTLMNMIIIFGMYAVIIAAAVGRSGVLAGIFGVLVIIFALGIVIPALAAAVRRLHDIGKSGWFYCVSFIPLAGPIWLLVLLATDSTPGENEYGPNPKTWEEDLINKI